MVFPALSALLTGTIRNFLGYIVPRTWPNNTNKFHKLFISLKAPGKLRGFKFHFNYFNKEENSSLIIELQFNNDFNDVGKCRLFIAVIMYSSFQLLTFSNFTEDRQVS